MSNYNPFIAIAKTAIAELTSDNAKGFYASRALEDIDRVITVFETVYALANFVYTFGSVMGEAHYSAVCTHTKADEPPQPCLPDSRPVALLAPAPMPLTGYRPIAALPAARLAKSLSNTDDFRRDSLNALTKAQLINLAKTRGLRATRKMAKPALIKLLVG